jgi:hypothetical protein
MTVTATEFVARMCMSPWVAEHDHQYKVRRVGTVSRWILGTKIAPLLTLKRQTCFVACSAGTSQHPTDRVNQQSRHTSSV